MNTLSHRVPPLRTGRSLAALDAAAQQSSEVVVASDATTFPAPEPASPPHLSEEPPGRAPDGVSDEELLRTFDERGALTELVQALYPDATPAQQHRAYAHLAQRRARLARTLRRTRRAACDWR
jgi:hypothetical protein